MYRPDDSGVTEIGALVVMLLAGLGLAILAYIFMPTAAGALECRERPGDSKSYWSYRIIDGNRCWYKGHGRKPKSQLHWPDEPKPKKLKGDPVFNQIRAEVKTVDPDDVNEIDTQAQAKPLFMFPEIEQKVEALLNLWRHRWDTK